MEHLRRFGRPLAVAFVLLPVIFGLPRPAGTAPAPITTAKESNGFVSGDGLPGYTYPHLQPHPDCLARQAAPLLARSDLPVVSVLNTNQGDLPETAPILELPNVDGAIYKDYAPYNRHHGKIWWHRGKPCVSYRFLLWDRLMSPEAVRLPRSSLSGCLAVSRPGVAHR